MSSYCSSRSEQTAIILILFENTFLESLFRIAILRLMTNLSLLSKTGLGPDFLRCILFSCTHINSWQYAWISQEYYQFRYKTCLDFLNFLQFRIKICHAFLYLKYTMNIILNINTS